MWPLALYVHTPFCAYRCRYCNFVFETGWSPRVVERTLQKLDQEVELWKPLLQQRGWNGKIRTLYWGGGTPSVIPLRQLEASLQRQSKLWDLGSSAVEEWTIEVNPENLSAEMLKVFSDQGVTRLSLGIQTFQDQALAVLGRRTDSRTNHRALELMASNWKGSWSADLMTGLPGQTEVQTDLKTLFDYQPPHVSLYALTVEEGTPLATMVRQKRVNLPEERADELWIQARDELIASGREWYEVSNFAFPGHEGKHNQTYWRLEPYLGLGPGAASTLPAQTPAGNILERRQEAALFAWLSETPASVEFLGKSALLKEHFLTALRTREGLPLERLDSLGEEVRSWAESVGEAWRRQGWIQPGDHLALTPEGRLILDSLLRELSWPEFPEVVPDPL